MRLVEKITLTIIENGRDTNYMIPKGITLLEALGGLGVYLSTPCGGNARCGKCSVTIAKGAVKEPTLEEKRLIGEDGIKEGIRLACSYIIENDLTIIKPLGVGESEIVTDGIGLQKGNLSEDVSNLGLAIDIGTTTMVLYLVGLESGEVLETESSINPQSIHGADVMSRISYVDTSLSLVEEMRRLVVSEINRMIGKVMKKVGLDSELITRIVISGNTTMLHFLLGLRVEGMGTYPYTPESTKLKVESPSKMGIKINAEGQIIVLPSVSAFIGADIVAGIIATEMYKYNDYSLLIDLGTNGEMVLGNKDGMIACSAAMGPAFEGANIEHGIAGVAGAIDKFSIDHDGAIDGFGINHDGVFFSTISGKEPIGICGSGIIDLVAGLLKAGIIDKTGRMVGSQSAKDLANLHSLKDRIIDFKGKQAFIISHRAGEPILFTQQDVRQVQLAKSAIAVGINALIENIGITDREIEHVYLAGGFGNFINIENAVIIGLIPERLKDKIVSAGNTSGSGAVMCLTEPQLINDCVEITQKIEYFDLSSIKRFQDLYIDNLNFG